MCNFLVRCKIRAAFLIRYVQLPTDSDDSECWVYEFQTVRQSRSTCFMLLPICREGDAGARYKSCCHDATTTAGSLSLSKRRNHFPALFAPTPPIFGTVCEKWGSEWCIFAFQFSCYLRSHTLSFNLLLKDGFINNKT